MKNKEETMQREKETEREGRNEDEEERREKGREERKRKRTRKGSDRETRPSGASDNYLSRVSEHLNSASKLLRISSGRISCAR